jgi:hypothetical protein
VRKLTETRSFYGAALEDVLRTLEEDLGQAVHLSLTLRRLDRRVLRDYSLAVWVPAEGTASGFVDLREERLTMPLSLGDELDLLVEMCNSLASRMAARRAWMETRGGSSG